MNFLFAYILFVAVMMMGRPILSATIGGFVEGYPAQASGLKVGDQVTEVNGIQVNDWQELTLRIMESRGTELVFSVVRGGESHHITVIPQFDEGKDIFGMVKRLPRIGIKPSDHFTVERYDFSNALVRAIQFEGQLTSLTFESLWRLVTGRLSLKAISGPIGIVSMAGHAAQMGGVALMQFTGILSVSLGVINVLPIPA